MEYLLRIIKRDVADSLKDIWETMSQDIELTEDAFADFYGSMGRYMYRLEKYEKLSEFVKDLEAGEWGVVGLDHACDGTMADWWNKVTSQAYELYNKEN